WRKRCWVVSNSGRGCEPKGSPNMLGVEVPGASAPASGTRASGSGVICGGSGGAPVAGPEGRRGGGAARAAGPGEGGRGDELRGAREPVGRWDHCRLGFVGEGGRASGGGKDTCHNKPFHGPPPDISPSVASASSACPSCSSQSSCSL